MKKKQMTNGTVFGKVFTSPRGDMDLKHKGCEFVLKTKYTATFFAILAAMLYAINIR